MEDQAVAMPEVLRILDANGNRAREALRVMEDYARFAMDDASLSEAIKLTRHDLRTCFPDALPAALVCSRDIVSDVGCEVSTEAEQVRETSQDVVIAACKRLSEALRTMEEYGKTLDATLARGLERLRYRGYELERRLRVTMAARDRLADIRLYVLITEALCQGDWMGTAEAALRGGANCLQLREKHLSDAELAARATRLTSLCHDHGARCIVNDRADIAAISGADGVHLGQDDVSVAQARRLLPAGAVVGLSTHTRSQIDAAIEVVPDYIAVGPMFASHTKPQAHTAGLDTLTYARARTALPLVAIGGMTVSNAGDVLRAADCCLCVCSSIVGEAGVAQACRNFVSVIESHHPKMTADK